MGVEGADESGNGVDESGDGGSGDGKAEGSSSDDDLPSWAANAPSNKKAGLGVGKERDGEKGDMMEKRALSFGSELTQAIASRSKPAENDPNDPIDGPDSKALSVEVDRLRSDLVAMTKKYDLGEVERVQASQAHEDSMSRDSTTIIELRTEKKVLEGTYINRLRGVKGARINGLAYPLPNR